MTTIRMTREAIAAAIAKEPVLYSGAWSVSPLDDDKVSDPACRVCAVGAVMRAALDPDQNYVQIEYAAQEAVDTEWGAHHSEECHAAVLPHYREIENLYNYARKLIADNKPITALSALFEGISYINESQCLGFTSLAIKNKVVEFVEQNFPDSVLMDIDGAKPAMDVKVISITEDEDV